MAQTAKTERYIINANGCWIWQLGLNEDGYATEADGNRSKRLVHKYNYEQKHGSIPNGMVLDHKCKRTVCVNPDHLEAATQAVNVQRGRVAKLSANVVNEIRTLYKLGLSKDLLAIKFGVHKTTITRIINNQTWRSI